MARAEVVLGLGKRGRSDLPSVRPHAVAAGRLQRGYGVGALPESAAAATR